jgi:sugar lactone lactonase YvrE
MRKSLQGILLIIYSISVVAALTSCKKSTPILLIAPTVVTNNIMSQLSSTTATSGGVVTSIENGDAIGLNGVCWSATNPTPTTADSKTTDSVQTHFISKITGLSPNTTYYLRAYATGTGGTGYGGVIIFKTTSTAAIPVGVVTTLAGSTSGNSGYADGSGAGALFDGPLSIAYNKYSGLLYLGDLFNNLIRTVTTTGTTNTLTSPTIGFSNGTLSSASFYSPRGFSFDAQGNTYVADMGNDAIRKITSAGIVTTFAGTGSAGYIDGTTTAEFYNPQSTVIDAAGNIYVADRTNNLIRKITPTGTVSVLAGAIAPAGTTQSAVPGYVDGSAAIAQFNYPCALAIDASGNLFVADLGNHAIREVSPTGNVTTFAGGPNFPDQVGVPSGVALDAQGDVFVSDETGRVIEIASGSKALYLLAGAENKIGYADGTGAAAQFNNPQGLTFDSQGNLYVADFGNNVVRKIVLTAQ